MRALPGRAKPVSAWGDGLQKDVLPFIRPGTRVRSRSAVKPHATWPPIPAALHWISAPSLQAETGLG